MHIGILSVYVALFANRNWKKISAATQEIVKYIVDKIIIGNIYTNMNFYTRFPIELHIFFLLFYRLFYTRCTKCDNIIQREDLVMKAKEYVYHLDCFSCFYCDITFSAGKKKLNFDIFPAIFFQGFRWVRIWGRFISQTDCWESNLRAEISILSKYHVGVFFLIIDPKSGILSDSPKKLIASMKNKLKPRLELLLFYTWLFLKLRGRRHRYNKNTLEKNLYCRWYCCNSRRRTNILWQPLWFKKNYVNCLIIFKILKSILEKLFNPIFFSVHQRYKYK